MKRYCLILLIALLSISLSAEGESWFSTGFEHSHIFEWSDHGSGLEKTDINSKGISFSAYIFKGDRDFGLFLHSSLLAPYDGSHDSDFKGADLNIANSIIIGPAYRGPEFYNLLQPYGSLGLHYLHYTFHDSVIFGTESYDIMQLTQNLGIGGEIACKLNFTDYFYVGIGTILIWDFFSVSRFAVDGDWSTENPDRYNSLWVDPFIAVGFVWKTESSD